LLTGYAYETVASAPIVTGQTSGKTQDAALTPSGDIRNKVIRPENSRVAPLSLLALGSSGLAAWRREETT
jgi:hypothetical protein